MQRSLSSQPELVLDCRLRLGESIVWDDRAAVLRWVNIHDGEVWAWDPKGAAPPRVTTLPERVGALGLRQNGGLVLAFEKGFALMEPGTDVVTRLAAVDAGLPSVRLNDGRVDPAGRFVCGGMDEASPQQPLANLYAVAGGTPTLLLDGISCTNSLCWSPDGRVLYFTDMPSRRIEAFDYDVGTSALSNRRLFADLAGEPGLADGSVVDAEGCVWNAQWGGAKLVRYRPDGYVDREVPFPVSNPTCMAFGGPDLDILFVTSAWFTPSGRDSEPEAGHLFAFRPGVRGRPEHRYAG